MSHLRSYFRNRFSTVNYAADSVQFAPDFIFWAAFLILNLLLFLPLFLLNWGNEPVPQSAIPALGMGLTGPLLLWRNSGELLRLNLEITLLTALGVFIHHIRGALYRWVFAALYLFALLYYIYEGVTLSVYNAEPVIYNQYHLYADGLPFLLQHLHLSPLLYLAIFGLLVAGMGFVLLLVRTMLNDARIAHLSRWTRVGLGVLTLLLALMAVSYRAALANPQMMVSSLTYKVQRNMSESLALRASAASFDGQSVRAAYSVDKASLLTRPNVYLIFVESYGSVLYKRDDYRIVYTQLLDELNTELETNDWHAVSALSTAPTWGGGSWFSYTSALFGLRIDNQPQFLSLFDSYQSEAYPDLGHFLKSEGYDYNWLTSIATELPEEKWLQYQHFYGTDQWYRHRDLAYVGPEYSWGPAPPDQYALNYTRESIRERISDPFLLFFITQTSHYPWTDLPAVVDDWRTLNQEVGPVTETTIETLTDPDAMPHATRRRNYMRAIDYELRFLVDAILAEDEDSIFVLIGDHQPPRVSRRDDGWETPVHIISRDEQLLAEFAEYGFTPGLIAPDLEPDLHHEGFYSLFMRSLLARYGDQTERLPAYLPNGAIPEQIEDVGQ